MEFSQTWTPQVLRRIVRTRLKSRQLIVVSNREPYIHDRDASGRPVVQVPASGMVAALDPVVRACSGVWIAHGSGTADRDVVDEFDHVGVPPADPAYTLRRVWLSRTQERGYYQGFANEGLWPLCHRAYVKPVFRETHWRSYVEVNAEFADIVAAESNGACPVVLIQDFHVALLPGLVRSKLPQATIVLFWHIPWPAADTFELCPWYREMLSHMLDADIIGFHTPNHCQRFLDAAERVFECRSGREGMAVVRGHHRCHVAPYPISIQWPPVVVGTSPDVATCRIAIRRRCGTERDVVIGLSVDRWDFTKGIIQRLEALEALLDKDPSYRCRICLLQIVAPSRSALPAYHTLQQRTYYEVERINRKWGDAMWRPIVLIDEYQEPKTLWDLYRGADFCWVNSLDDGMNLVAKEFVAARDDEDGVLLLSAHAGAAQELIEAVIVNPFDVAGSVVAIRDAISLGADERRRRMIAMRNTVMANNVYRWAGRMLMDAARVRRPAICN